MTDPSHEPFVKLVLNCTNAYNETQIRSWLSGETSDKTLSGAFSAWSRGDSSEALRVLNPTLHATLNGKDSEVKTKEPEATATPT